MYKKWYKKRMLLSLLFMSAAKIAAMEHSKVTVSGRIKHLETHVNTQSKKLSICAQHVNDYMEKLTERFEAVKKRFGSVNAIIDEKTGRALTHELASWQFTSPLTFYKLGEKYPELNFDLKDASGETFYTLLKNMKVKNPEEFKSGYCVLLLQKHWTASSLKSLSCHYAKLNFIMKKNFIPCEHANLMKKLKKGITDFRKLFKPMIERDQYGDACSQLPTQLIHFLYKTMLPTMGCFLLLPLSKCPKKLDAYLESFYIFAEQANICALVHESCLFLKNKVYKQTNINLTNPYTSSAQFKNELLDAMSSIVPYRLDSFYFAEHNLLKRFIVHVLARLVATGYCRDQQTIHNLLINPFLIGTDKLIIRAFLARKDQIQRSEKFAQQKQNYDVLFTFKNCFY